MNLAIVMKNSIIVIDWVLQFVHDQFSAYIVM